MARIKYKYNPKTLSYEEVKLTRWDIGLKMLAYVIAASFFAFIVSILAFEFVDSPQEKAKDREIEYLKLNLNLLSKRLEQSEKILANMQDRDDNIYRVIFESDPLSESERMAGFGGVDRYAKLDGYRNSNIILDATKRMDKLQSKIVVQSKSYDELWNLAKNKQEMLSHIPAIQPLNRDNKRVRFVSGFGMRFHPILKIRRMHWGVDISAPKGTPIYATADGVINFTGRRGSYGNVVIIDHGFGYKTLYAHMNSISVKRKQSVKRGQVIGYVGNTGLSEGSHVHYEIFKKGKRVNPINYFYQDFTPEEFEKLLEIASRDNQVLS